jgi:hypothetical protein
MNLNGYVVAIGGLLPAFLVFGLKSEFKEDLRHFLTKALGVMIFLSLIWYLLFLVGVNLPHFEYVVSGGDYENQYSIYYFFVIKHDGDLLAMLLPRFPFVFYEPGYFGCLMAVLLFLDDYKFDKKHLENFVFLLSLILSLSLAGIIIGIFGFIAYFIKNSTHKVRWLTLTILVFGAFYFGVTNYNNGDNLINNALFSRFEINENTGTIEGNSRFSSDVSDYFWKDFIHTSNLFLGLGVEKGGKILTNDNVDYLSFTIRYGLLATLFLLYFFLLPFNK